MKKSENDQKENQNYIFFLSPYEIEKIQLFSIISRDRFTALMYSLRQLVDSLPILFPGSITTLKSAQSVEI